MIPEERRKNILIKLKEKEIYRIDDLACELDVSKITILRDIQLLKTQGLINRIHGGVKIADNGKSSFESRFSVRISNNFEKKAEIAKKALTFVRDGSSIFLDSSSTVFVFASELFKQQYFEQNIITNSPAIIAEALKYPGLNLISTGGELKQDFNIFGGSWVSEFLDKINIDYAFISAAGISSEGKITTNNKDLAGILATIFKKKPEINLLIDSTKFFKKGLLNIASISDCKRIITDSSISKTAVKSIKELFHIELIY